MSRRRGPLVICATRRSVRNGGFTLIEIVIVIVVLAVISLTAIPAIRQISQNRARMAHRHLIADLTHARQTALALGATAWVDFSVSDDQWSLHRDQPDQPGWDHAEPMMDAGHGAPYVVTLGIDPFAGVTLTGAAFDGTSRVGFDYLGRPVIAGGAPLTVPGTVTLNSGHTVTVEPETGYISPN